MKFWTKIAPLTLALAFAGCSSADMADFPGQPMCGINTPEGCLNNLNDACELKDLLAHLCTDEDNDCFYSACRSDAPKWITQRLLDCNDQNPDIHPFREERCDGRDENCDGQIDEGFALGQSCAECGGGVLECAVDDPQASVCSTLPGQSAGPSFDAAEICDGTDDDCDGRIDENCRLDTDPEVLLEQVRLCGDTLFSLQGGDIARRTIGEFENSQVIQESVTNGQRLQCGDGGLAWLETEQCVDVADEPNRCTAIVWVRPADGDARAITGLGSYGAPLVHKGSVYFHSIVEGTPYINRHDFDDQPPRVVIENASDPNPPNADGDMVVRSWDEGERARVKLRSITEAGREGVITNPRTGASAPVANDQWVAWIAGDDRNALWVVPFSDLTNGGFIAVAIEGRHLDAIQLVDDTVFFLSKGASRTQLESFNLNSGRRMVIAGGSFVNDSYSAQTGHIAWIQETNERPQLRLMTRPNDEANE